MKFKDKADSLETTALIGIAAGHGGYELTEYLAEQ